MMEEDNMACRFVSVAMSSSRKQDLHWYPQCLDPIPNPSDPPMKTFICSHLASHLQF